jgi:hypothetical protein
LRLLIACLLLAVTVEPASAQSATCTPAQIVAIADVRSVGAPSAVREDAQAPASPAIECKRSRFRPQLVGVERPRVEPIHDGRHLYLTHCTLLC